ncbi:MULTISPECIES: helix-turn-helix domain-containing protein [Streptomyces]|uniref:Transcriptional regulator with XRE-family HTH domain n=1 Tax=Streptomyces stelliscabiei TaxID=146820 RepID=A0A8I0PGF2_9ACTN|nr:MULTISPECIES: helix-turn-helix transcriptional regulator [Streptomyces]KND39752.1 XRE family transcriptional regulator [Streptomyces stelliscabiei]MBE1603054.1 transcriptional regulator with XRE-family HTH domain [Streptomyces stelliscabiei]MDX2521634.1 helix-turn-helix transcriptional regulator [Streptomyces stelliscabiei]MDX2557615.1 helix-turn-helix transcriptional regulator [Streptomyces stelliscabiei]MDX2576766.1 helix-turn-helix transcriptional regulator [Streptomyces scabiei]
MDRRKEIREFLTSRRARITPEQAGLPVYGRGSRRVPGLRREEVALLAGVSVDYYTQLERGNGRGVSDSVLDNLARALKLTEAEHTHLFDLVRAANATTRPRRAARAQVRPAVQRFLDALTIPALVWTARSDTLAANRLGRALFSPVLQDRPLPVNNARFVFLDPKAQELFGDWEDVANDTVAVLRWEAGRNPYDRALTDLVGELSTRSEFFRTRWAAHNVHVHRNGVKKFHHPIVGDLSLAYELMSIEADTGLTLISFSPEPGSPSEDALGLLASWAATIDREQAPPPAPKPDPRRNR